MYKTSEYMALLGSHDKEAIAVIQWSWYIGDPEDTISSLLAQKTLILCVNTIIY